MKTCIIKEDVRSAAELIRKGKLVAVPTETVYGLAANGLDESAVRAVYEIKGRPEAKPLSLMVPGPEAIAAYTADAPRSALHLAARFWPGPLTIVLRAADAVPAIVRAGGDTVGLRCPDHPLTLEALRLAGVPFAAPSANPSGEPSPKTAEDVQRYFDGKIPAIIDGGPCGIGRESTILDMSSAPYRVLREGALPENNIAEALADCLVCIGITGGTGCGKTTALQELEKRGALILDCDAIYHELLEHDHDMLRELDESFPGTVVDGKLERKSLGAVVFSDPQALALLNRITHHYVGIAVQKRMEDWAMRGGALVAIDAIELIGSGLAARCRATVGIIADEEVRAARIMARDGISREYALLRIRAQKPDQYFKDNCDYVLENNGDRSAFTGRFNRMIKEILNNG
ncbi:MAG: threonylcarbamoyl-AMP synthase [Oscillospiraceae bacterium]|nr:threonylcarbamoyl-AMP synthase [Oscillospiraceae bacterium]